MSGKIVKGDVIDLDRSEFIEVSKPLFYAYTFLAGLNMLISTNGYAGTFMGMAGLASLTFVSAALAKGVKNDWQSLLDLISITTLLMTVLFGTYAAVHLSMFG